MNIAIKIYNEFYYFRERINLAGVKRGARESRFGVVSGSAAAPLDVASEQDTVPAAYAPAPDLRRVGSQPAQQARSSEGAKFLVQI